MEDRSPDMLRSTLVAGVTFGTLGAIPYVRLLNGCCLLLAACGFVAAYLYSRVCRRAHVAFHPGSGATVGLIAAAFYALSQTIVDAVMVLTVGNDDVRMVFQRLRQLSPPENVKWIDGILAQLSQPDAIGARELMLEFFFSLLLGAVVSTLGGLVGGAAFRVAPAGEPPSVPSA